MNREDDSYASQGSFAGFTVNMIAAADDATPCGRSDAGLLHANRGVTKGDGT